MSPGRRLAAWLAGLLVLGLALYALRSVLLPFVAGMAVAYFLDPLVDRFEGWKLSRTMATTVVTALFFILVVLVAILMVPVIYEQITGFAERLPSYVERVRAFLLPLVENVLAALAVSDTGEITGAVAGAAFDAVNIVRAILGRLLSGGLALVNLLSLIFITPVAAFYLLRDWDRLVAKVDSLLPREQAAVIRALFIEIDQVLAGFVRGTGSVCLILGAFYATALTLVGLDFGLLVGLGAGLISFIPFVGAIVGLVVSGTIALFQFWPDYPSILLVIVIFAAGQAAEGNILTPRLVGQRVRLHPVWVMFGLLAGGVLFGFVGVLLAVPGAAAVGVLVRFGLARYQNSPLYLGSERGGPPPGTGS